MKRDLLRVGRPDARRVSWQLFALATEIKTALRSGKPRAAARRQDARDDLREAEPADAGELRDRHVPARRPRHLSRAVGHPARRARDRRRRRPQPGAGRRHDRRAHVPPRGARRARRAREGAGDQRAHRPAPSRARCSPTSSRWSSTAGSSTSCRVVVHRRRQQPRALVDGGGDALPVHVRRRLPDRLRAGHRASSPTARAPARGSRSRRRSPTRSAAPTSSTPTSGPAWARRTRRRCAATRFAELPDQRRRHAPRRQGRARDALPAGPSRRGDHRRACSRAASRSSSTRPRTGCTSRRR
mgnify:CR=1 FL=1